MMQKTKYEFTPDMGNITKWAAEGAWQERVCRQMILAGVEYLEKEQSEYVGLAIWRNFSGPTQAQRLADDAKGDGKITRALHELFIQQLELSGKLEHRDAPELISIAIYTIMFIAGNSWDKFVQNMIELNKQEVAKMN